MVESTTDTVTAAPSTETISHPQEEEILAGHPPQSIEDIRDTYRDRRDVLLDAVEDCGLDPGYTPEGAYYLLVDISDLPGDSMDVAEAFLEEAGVAVTPGVDFGEGASEYVRLSYATDTESIKEGARRIAVSHTHLRASETTAILVCRPPFEKLKTPPDNNASVRG
jgi:aspartate/methionine/tyrosine aminotransferase